MNSHHSAAHVGHDIVLTAFNAAAWLATAITAADLSTVATIVSIFMSISVSVASFLWIRKQSAAFDKAQAVQEDERLRVAAEHERESWLKTRITRPAK